MNYTKVRKEIEREIEEQEEVKSIQNYNQMMEEIGVEVK